MELYFAWSLYKYVVVAIIIALVVMVGRVFIPSVVSDNAKRDTWSKRLLYSGLGLYALLVALSLNTGASVLNADKSKWSAPVMEAPVIERKENTNKQDARKALDESTQKLLESIK